MTQQRLVALTLQLAHLLAQIAGSNPPAVCHQARWCLLAAIQRYLCGVDQRILLLRLLVPLLDLAEGKGTLAGCLSWRAVGRVPGELDWKAPRLKLQ